jgi:methylthioribose-1-phosphate isomerase
MAELRETSATAGRELARPPAAQAAAMAQSPARVVPEPGFRSAYLYGDALLRLLDARQLPARNVEVTCHDASEVAAAIRAGVVSAGPVLAEVAAYALLMTAERTADRADQARRQHWQAAANTLRGARGFVHAVVTAIDRLEQRRRELEADGQPAGQAIGDLRQAADSIATDAALEHARLGRLGSEALLTAAATPLDQTINVLIHGDMGPLSCGQVGTGLAVLAAVQAAGRQLHAWLPEGAPSLAGQRIGALQLNRADIAHTVIPDSAVGWLLAHRLVDAVLLRGDWICANGDGAAPLGSATIARLATTARVPVYVCATTSSFDPTVADSGGLPTDPAATATVGRLNPATDIVPASDVTAFLTEDGARPGPH